MRILPQGLEKLCIDLDVKHKKLTETISHDDITLDNYTTFPALPTYLSHDVRGLLEVMLNFNHSVFDDLKIDVTTCFTGASLSKSTFYRNYYNKTSAPYIHYLMTTINLYEMGTLGGVLNVLKWVL